MGKKPNQYSEKLSVGFTPEQVRRLDELLRIRARKGDLQHKTDLIRAAVNLYLAHQDDLPGTRAAITRTLEGRLSGVETKLEALEAAVHKQNALLERMVAFFSKRREG